MKISVINDNEIFLNYLITDTSEEMNIPILNEGYSLLVGSADNNLKTLTVDNLKDIFHENKQKYTIFISSLNFDKLTFDVTAYEKGNELISNYDLSKHFVINDNVLLNDEIEISLCDNFSWTDKIIPLTIITSYHDNILKNIDDQKIKNKEKLTLINEKLNEYYIPDKNFKYQNYCELTDADINYLDNNEFNINFPNLEDFRINDLVLPDLSEFKVDISLNVNELKFDTNLPYEIKDVSVPNLNADLVKDFTIDNLEGMNLNLLTIPDFPDLQFCNINISISKEMFNELNIPTISCENFSNLKVPTINEVNFGSISCPSFSSSMINLISIPTINDENFEEIDVKCPKFEDFDEINFSKINSDIFKDVTVPTIKNDMFKNITINDVELPLISYSINSLNTPCISNIVVNTPNFKEIEFISIDLNDNFNDAYESVISLEMPKANFNDIKIPKFSDDAFNDIVINEVKFPSLNCSVIPINIPDTTNISINDIDIPDIPNFTTRRFNVPVIFDEIINNFDIPKVEYTLNELNVPTTNKIINSIETPDLPTISFNDPKYKDKLNETIQKIVLPTYNDINLNLSPIIIPNINDEMFNTLTIDGINYTDLDDLEINNLKIPKIDFDASLDNLKFNYNFEALKHEEIVFTNINNELITLRNRLNNLTMRIEVSFSCYNAINNNQIKVDNILIDNSIVSSSKYSCSLTDGVFKYLIGKRGISSKSYRAKDEFDLCLQKSGFNDYKIDNILLKNYSSVFLSNTYTKIIDLGHLPLIPAGIDHAFVLTWDGQPEDLDSHVYIFDSSYNQIGHVLYNNKNSCDVSLDHDCTTCGREWQEIYDEETDEYIGEDVLAPETISIRNTNKSYYYLWTIHHYTGYSYGDYYYDEEYDDPEYQEYIKEQLNRHEEWNNNTKLNLITNGKRYEYSPRANTSPSCWLDVLLLYNGTFYICRNFISKSKRSPVYNFSFDVETAKSTIQNMMRNYSQKIQTK